MVQVIRNERRRIYFLRQRGAIPVLTTTILLALLSTWGIEGGHRFAKYGGMIANGTSAEGTRMNGHMNNIARGSESGAEA
jgi:hypothetical protein